MPGYKLTPAAIGDLENIWRYTETEWGIAQAEFYIDQMDEAFQLLAEQPQLSRLREEFTPPVRIYHQAHHLIVYDTHPEGILVIRVLHENMDIDAHLSDA